MRIRARYSYTLTTLLSLPLAAGCGDDGATAPAPHESDAMISG